MREKNDSLKVEWLKLAIQWEQENDEQLLMTMLLCLSGLRYSEILELC